MDVCSRSGPEIEYECQVVKFLRMTVFNAFVFIARS